MASRPSGVGRALEQSANNFIRLLQLRDQRRARETQFGLEERRLDASDQARAFEKLITLAPLLTPGSTIGENPLLQGIARTAFADLGEDEFSALESIALQPETLKTIIADRNKQFAGELPADDPFFERVRNFETTGRAVTGERLELEETITGLQFEALETVASDPELLGNIGRTVLGQTPTVQIPGVLDQAGRPIDFQSEGVARIWSSLRNADKALSLRREEISKEASADIAGELIGQVESVGIALGRPKAQEIVNAFIASSEGRFEPGEAPIEKLFAASTPDEQKAIRLFTGAVRQGDSSFEEFLRTTPGGEKFIFLQGLGQFIDKDLNIESDEVLNVMQQFLEQFPDMGISIGSPGLFSIKDRFIFEDDIPSGEGRIGAEMTMAGQAAINTLRAGTETEESLRKKLGDEFMDMVIEAMRRQGGL